MRTPTAEAPLRRSIVMLTNVTAPDQMGGLERYVRELSGALAGSYQVRIVAKRVRSQDPAREICEDGVVVDRLRVPSKNNPLFGLLYPLYLAAGVARAVRADREALLHAHFAVMALPLALVPRRLRRPYQYTFHNPVYRELLDEHQDSYFLPRPLRRAVVAVLRRAERLVVERAEAVVVLSDFTRRELEILSPRAASRAVHIPGGIDLDWFTPGDAPAHEWADTAEHLLVTARRLTPRTGVLELIRAMPEIVTAHPGTRLAVMGDGHLMAEAQETVLDLGLDDDVLLLGRCFDADLRDWYRRADVAVTPTQDLEGFGLSTAEAMACGTSPLVTPVGANPELVLDLPPSCLATGTTPADLSRSVSQHLLDDARPDAQQVRDISETWSWTTVADRHRSALYGIPRQRS